MLRINFAEADKLQEAMKSYQGDVENSINDVLHNQGGDLIQKSVQQLIPVSGKSWSGKAPAAKSSKSLRSINENLGVTVTTQKKYQYLYFPDSGENTRRHAGRQYFFKRGGDAVKDDIIERCVSRLTVDFKD